MQSDATEQKVRKVMGQVFKLPVESIKADASRESLEQWDSLKHLNLMLALEEALDVEFSDSEIAEINSFQGLVTALRDKSN